MGVPFDVIDGFRSVADLETGVEGLAAALEFVVGVMGLGGDATAFPTWRSITLNIFPMGSIRYLSSLRK